MACLTFRTHLGWVRALEGEGGISSISLPTALKPSEPSHPSSELRRLAHDLVDYFRGGEADFSDYRLDLSGATPFQKRVWAAAMRIRRGETMTYGELAAAIGEPNSARAVGGALSANPIPVIIPCHRVVASDGLGGFSAGAVLKAKMLLLER